MQYVGKEDLDGSTIDWLLLAFKNTGWIVNTKNFIYCATSRAQFQPRIKAFHKYKYSKYTEADYLAHLKEFIFNFLSHSYGSDIFAYIQKDSIYKGIQYYLNNDMSVKNICEKIREKFIDEESERQFIQQKDLTTYMLGGNVDRGFLEKWGGEIMPWDALLHTQSDKITKEDILQMEDKFTPEAFKTYIKKHII
jgi:hypothetical protein